GRRFARRCARRARGGRTLMAAESEQGGGRTEEPSQRRLDQARERGQAPRAREVANVATMICGAAALAAVGGTVVGRMSHIMHNSLSLDPLGRQSPDSLTASLGEESMSGLIGI